MQTKTLEDDDGYRNKGATLSAGKIIKGTMHEAPIKLNVSSIPSKYENVIFKSKSQSAFGDSTKKFFKLSSNDSSLTPGPGNYNLNQSYTKIDSKKGSGFFASQSKLFKLERVRSHVPGPGSYKMNVQKSKNFSRKQSEFKKNQSQLNSSKSTAILSSRIQAHDLFKTEIDNSLGKPSVGAYELNPQKLIKSKSSYSSFKSKIDRFIIKKQDNPPVGYYQFKNADKTLQNFTRKTQPLRQQSQFMREKKLKKAIKNLEERETKQKLGPGTYEPGVSAGGKSFKIKQTIYDRFGQLKSIYQISTSALEQQVQITPFSDTGNKFNPSKTYNSIFKSTTQRHDFKLSNLMDPGVYNANKSSPKKSHLINFTQKWV